MLLVQKNDWIFNQEGQMHDRRFGQVQARDRAQESSQIHELLSMQLLNWSIVLWKNL